jgi:hypothetical protein
MHLMQSTSNKVWLSGMNLVPNRKMELMKEKIYFLRMQNKIIMEVYENRSGKCSLYG